MSVGQIEEHRVGLRVQQHKQRIVGDRCRLSPIVNLVHGLSTQRRNPKVRRVDCCHSTLLISPPIRTKSNQMFSIGSKQ